MNSYLKGRIVVNGAHIEIEADTPGDLASIISQVIKTARPSAPVVNTQNTAVVKTKVSKYSKLERNGYYKWTDKDVLLLARLAINWGPTRKGIGEKAYQLMKAEGDIKKRGKMNILIFVDRLHRYFYVGNKLGLNKNILTVLEKNGLTSLSNLSKNRLETTSIPQEA